MRNRRLVFSTFTLFLLLLSNLHAQYALEGLRFSRTGLNGTARYVSMGGALGALGADFSNISSNPAGLGFFRSSQFTLSPGFNFATSASNYQGTPQNDSRFTFQFGNLGAVFNKNMKKDRPEGLQHFNFAIGYNRTNSFNRSILISGDNTQSSLGDLFAASSNGLPPQNLNNFGEALAFNAFLIDTVPGGNGSTYFTNGPFGDELKRTSRQITSRGATGEISLAVAANISHRLYIGASLGIVRLDYSEVSSYGETDVENIIPGFSSLLFRETLQVEGTGVNLRIGAIYRANDWLRLGFALHTPTWMGLNESYQAFMETRFGSSVFTQNSSIGAFDYDLNMPWRWVGSVGLVLDKQAMLGIEYEYVDYSDMEFRSSSPFFAEPINNFVDTTFSHAHQLRLGGEYRWDPWRFRAGFHYLGDPFRTPGGINRSIESYTLGFGYRSRRWIWVDVAYMWQRTAGNERIFRDFTNEAPADIRINNHLLTCTIGFVF